MIHKLTHIHPDAKIANDVTIEPFTSVQVMLKSEKALG